MNAAKKKFWHGREKGKAYLSPEIWIAQKMRGRPAEIQNTIAGNLIKQTLIDNPEFTVKDLIQRCRHTGSTRKKMYAEKLLIIRKLAKEMYPGSGKRIDNEKRSKEETTNMLIQLGKLINKNPLPFPFSPNKQKDIDEANAKAITRFCEKEKINFSLDQRTKWIRKNRIVASWELYNANFSEEHLKRYGEPFSMPPRKVFYEWDPNVEPDEDENDLSAVVIKLDED